MALKFIDENDEGSFNFGGRRGASEVRIEVRDRRAITHVVGFDESSEYGTIQEAINDLPPEGGEVFIKEGIYVLKERIVINKDDISIRGNSWGVVLTGDFVDGSGGQECIYASGKDNISIENLTCQNTAHTITGITLINCDHVMVKKVKIGTTGGDGISLSGCEWGIVENNYIAQGNDGDAGIFIRSNSTNCVVKNNFVDNSKGIFIQGGDQNIIDGNIVDNPGLDGVILTEGSNNNVIVNNIILSPDQYGVNLEGASDFNLIAQNRINASAVGIFIEDSGSDKTLISSNILVGCTTPITDNGTNTTNVNNTS